MTGEVAAANVQARAQGTTTVALDLEPYASHVLVFSKRALPQTKTETVNNIPTPIDLSNNWQVTFAQNSSPIQMQTLRSWVEDDATRYFSGQATYEKKINVPDGFLQKGLSVKLDFGEGKPVTPQPLRNGMQTWLDAPVKDAAVVYVNGRRAGSAWCPPYSIELNGALQKGENTIRIVVSNTAINYMAGRKLPDYRLLNLRYGERFQPQDMDKVQPIPSGLTGTIRLIATNKK